MPQTGRVHAAIEREPGRLFPRCNKPGAAVRVLLVATDRPIDCVRCLARVAKYDR